MVIVPNSIIGKSQVINYTYPDPRYRIQTHLGIGYGADIATARRIIIETVRQVDGDDVDAIIQCGTNLSTLDIFPTLELWLEKPMIPINVATIWHALRACGIEDRITGRGRLLEEF